MKFLKVSNIKINIDQGLDDAFNIAIKTAGVSKNDVLSWKPIRYSIDARDKQCLKKVYSIQLEVNDYNKKRKNVTVADNDSKYKVSYSGTQNLINRPVIVGFGPAGMFCSYLLAACGYKPIIIERGSSVEKRKEKVHNFWSGEKLDENCNVQFGEGGAGTFSDGKLNTGIKDKYNRINFVLETFVKYGAHDNILYDSKPHVGTDVLETVVKNMREAIIKMGGTFYFDTKLEDLIFENNKLNAIKTNNGDVINTSLCVLAIGHSARDTFEMLKNKGIQMEQKPFAIGVRIEHKQSTINKSQYGFEDNRLGAAPYKLTYKANDGRGVYSFCMCPGGYVVNASSEEGRLAVNGMSYVDRNSENANSAIVTTINPEDFKSKDVLAGVELQRELEEKAFITGNGAIPIQRFEDFVNHKESNCLGEIIPQIKGGYKLCELHKVLPDYISRDIEEAIKHFGNVIIGFDNGDVILSAIESRTSSPVRILRDENMNSNIIGLMPAGEGAGYAGGITSAAIDGIKIFEKIAEIYQPLDNDFLSDL